MKLSVNPERVSRWLLGQDDEVRLLIARDLVKSLSKEHTEAVERDIYNKSIKDSDSICDDCFYDEMGVCGDNLPCVDRLDFKVGDIVRINSEEHLRSLGRHNVKGVFTGVVPEMIRMAGELHEISNVSRDGTYKVEGSIFSWNTEMLEPAEDDDLPDGKLYDFKVGDIVRIKPIEELKLVNGVSGKGKFYGLPDKMLEQAGKIMFVSSVNDDHYLLDDSPFRWSREMLEPAEEMSFLELLSLMLEEGDL